jgi:hypothetical protein
MKLNAKSRSGYIAVHYSPSKVIYLSKNGKKINEQKEYCICFHVNRNLNLLFFIAVKEIICVCLSHSYLRTAF